MSFEGILRYYQSINTLARSLHGRCAFDELHIRIPDATSPEASFIRATSWLYCLYFEAGRVSLVYLRRMGEAYSILDREKADLHVEQVRCLRTELHHNLGFGDADQTSRRVAQMWLKKACGTALPQNAAHWKACYTQITGDASSFLRDIDEVVRRIEAEGNKARIHIDEWLHRLQRSWPAAAFDSLIDKVKYQVARDALDTVSFRNKHLDLWRRNLEVLEDGFNFEFEATRLIEMTLLNEDSVVLPITGHDVIEFLEIEPGPAVAELLEEARRYFEVNRCSRRELIDHLRNYECRFS